MLLLYNMVRNLISCPFPHCSDVVGWPTVECDCSLEPAEIVYYKSYREMKQELKSKCAQEEARKSQIISWQALRKDSKNDKEDNDDEGENDGKDGKAE